MTTDSLQPLILYIVLLTTTVNWAERIVELIYNAVLKLKKNHVMSC